MVVSMLSGILWKKKVPNSLLQHGLDFIENSNH